MKLPVTDDWCIKSGFRDKVYKLAQSANSKFLQVLDIILNKCIAFDFDHYEFWLLYDLHIWFSYVISLYLILILFFSKMNDLGKTSLPT